MAGRVVGRAAADSRVALPSAVVPAVAEEAVAEGLGLLAAAAGE